MSAAAVSSTRFQQLEGDGVGETEACGEVQDGRPGVDLDPAATGPGRHPLSP